MRQSARSFSAFALLHSVHDKIWGITRARRGFASWPWHSATAILLSRIKRVTAAGSPHICELARALALPSHIKAAKSVWCTESSAEKGDFGLPSLRSRSDTRTSAPPQQAYTQPPSPSAQIWRSHVVACVPRPRLGVLEHSIRSGDTASCLPQPTAVILPTFIHLPTSKLPNSTSTPTLLRLHSPADSHPNTYLLETTCRSALGPTRPCH